MNIENLVKEISKKLNVSEEKVLKGINDLEIDVFESGEDAYRNIMLEDLNKSDLIDLFLNVIKEDVPETSPLQSWLNNYDGIINTPFGVAYVNQSFYNERM